MDAYGSLGFEPGVELQRDEQGNVLRGIRNGGNEEGQVFFDVPQGQAGRYDQYADIDGQRMYRLGNTPQGWLTGANKYAPGLTSWMTKDNIGARYDPQYGWIAPASVIDPVQGAVNETAYPEVGFWGDGGPWQAYAQTIGLAMGASGLASWAGAGAGASGAAGAFDASGVGTGVDAGVMSSNAGLGSGVTGPVFPSIPAGTEGITQGTVDTAGLGTDATGAFDMGQFNPSDVGLDASTFPATDALTSGIAADPFATGAFDMGQFLPSDVGLDASTFPGADGSSFFPPSSRVAGFSDPSGNFDASSSVDPEGYRSEVADTVSEPFTDTSKVQGALDKLLKYGPLGLGALSAFQQRSGNRQFADQLRQLGGPQRALGEQLLGQFQSGTLNPADTARIDEWAQGATAASRQFFARAGTSDSTQARTSEQSIRQKAEEMRQQARQNLLKVGLDALNVTDRYQAAAITAEMQGDAQARAGALQFLGAYGSWLRALPQMTGAT